MKSKAKYAAFMGIALALTAVLSFADSCISAAFPIPGIRLGLANIALLRSGFVFLTRGASAAVMSLSGGLLAFAAAAVLMIIMKRSCKFSCIIAAMCHTLGQLAAACVLTGSVYTLAYVVVLMPVSIFTGFLTGTVLQALQGFLDDRKVVK